jgi:antitoxin component of MazEF toxin-antitoxin module
LEILPLHRETSGQLENGLTWWTLEDPMATQIARTGCRVSVEIPEDLLRQANLSVGDSVEWRLSPTGSLILHTPQSAECAPCPGDYEQWKQDEICAGFAEIEAGESVPNAKVIEWLRSWGTTNELPPPL